MRNASKHGVDTGLTGKRDPLDTVTKLETARLTDCWKSWKEKSRVAHICRRKSNLETELLDSNWHRNFSGNRHCYCKSSCIEWYKDQRNQTESEICWIILVIVTCWNAIAGKNTKTHLNKYIKWRKKVSMASTRNWLESTICWTQKQTENSRLLKRLKRETAETNWRQQGSQIAKFLEERSCLL